MSLNPLRWSRRTKLIAGIACALLPFVGLLGWWLIDRSAVNAELAALKSQGLPTTAAEVNDFYKVPEGVPDTTSLWVAAIDSVKSANLNARGASLPILGEGATPIPPPGEPWSDLEASRALVGSCVPQLSAIRKAAEAGGQARYPVDFSAGINAQLPYTQESRQVGRLLALDAHVAAHDGDNDRALQDVRAIFATSDALRGEPSMISQLVRIAIFSVGCDAVEKLLPYCQWSDAELDSLQESVRSARPKDEIARALCGERALTLSALDTAGLGPLHGSNVQMMLEFFKDSLAGFAEPWPKPLRRQQEMSDRIRSLAGGRISRIRYMGVLMLLPAMEGMAIAGARCEARQRCTNVVLAAARHRLKHGQLPGSLAEIDASLFGPASDPAVQLLDPFDAQPLRFKSDENGIVVYSIGEDGEDDGGQITWWRAVGMLHPHEKEPRDVGMSLKK